MFSILWSFSVQQQVAQCTLLAKIKILYLYDYVSTKISSASRINHGSLWSRDIFQSSGLYFLFALQIVILTGMCGIATGALYLATLARLCYLLELSTAYSTHDCSSFYAWSVLQMGAAGYIPRYSWVINLLEIQYSVRFAWQYARGQNNIAFTDFECHRW